MDEIEIPSGNKPATDSTQAMKHSIRSAFALAAAAFCLAAATAFSQEERPTKAIYLDWQRDIHQFVTYLKGIAAEATVPTEDDLKTRMENENGGLEVITDGYGGVVDFNAAKGTVQQVATEKFAGGGSGPTIVWEFELAQDANASWDKSIVLTPKLAENAGEKRKEGGQRFFQIMIAKSDGGPFRAGDRVSLESSIDDFSRFRKDFSKATGLVAVYYLEESPNPVFLLKLSDAKITSIKPKPGEQDSGGQPATRPESK